MQGVGTKKKIPFFQSFFWEKTYFTATLYLEKFTHALPKRSKKKTPIPPLYPPIHSFFYNNIAQCDAKHALKRRD